MQNDFSKVQDSGKRQEFQTGSRRDTRDGKGRYDLLPGQAMLIISNGNPSSLPPYAVFRLARHYENGAAKYGEHNWTKGQPLCRYLDSAMRHMFKALDGLQDEDHLAAGAWNMIGFVETKYRIGIGLLPSTLNDMVLPVTGPESRHMVVAEKCSDSTSDPAWSVNFFVSRALYNAFMCLQNLDGDHASQSALNMMMAIEATRRPGIEAYQSTAAVTSPTVIQPI
jgi:hypothetical protein